MTALRADQAVRARKVHSAARPSWFSQTHTAVPPSYAVSDGRQRTHTRLVVGRPFQCASGKAHIQLCCVRGSASCVHHSAARASCRAKSRDSFHPAGTKLSLLQIGLRLQGIAGRTRRPLSLRSSQERMSARPSVGSAGSLSRPTPSWSRLSGSYSSGGDPA
jgi:hypothetical protein